MFSVCRYGPRLMAPCKPLNLRPLVVVYNLACAGLNLYIFSEILVTSRQINYSWTCQPVDYSSDPASVRIARALWWYYISKLFEMLGKYVEIYNTVNRLQGFMSACHPRIIGSGGNL